MLTRMGSRSDPVAQPSQRVEVKKEARKVLESRFSEGKNKWFFAPLRVRRLAVVASRMDADAAPAVLSGLPSRLRQTRPVSLARAGVEGRTAAGSHSVLCGALHWSSSTSLRSIAAVRRDCTSAAVC